jgi:hypothetical protein
VLLNEQAAAVVDGRRWLHQAVYWLFGEGAADVRISLPPGASALGVDVDGAPEPLPQPGPDRLRLALAAGPRIVRIFWTFPDSLDPLPRPNLALPRLLAVGSEVKEARPLWTVHVPPGYRVENPRGLTPASAAESDFRRAEGEHLLTSLLVERGGDLGSEPLRGQLLASQERFLWYWRRAHDRMGQSAWLAPFAVSESPTMAAALEKLAKRSTHLLQSRGVPALGSEARQRTHNGAFLPLPDDMALKPQESASSSAFKIDLPERGTPTFWTMQDKGGAPDLELTTGEEERSEHALVATWFLLCILLGAWALSLIPHLLSGFQKAWPEQIILLGWLVWQVVGFPIAGIALMGMGGLARLFPFFRWFSALFSQGAARVPHSSGSGSSS